MFGSIYIFPNISIIYLIINALPQIVTNMSGRPLFYRSLLSNNLLCNVGIYYLIHGNNGKCHCDKNNWELFIFVNGLLVRLKKAFLGTLNYSRLGKNNQYTNCGTKPDSKERTMDILENGRRRKTICR